jgi:glutamate-1-semialdehyde 2,1-aminomutase
VLAKMGRVSYLVRAGAFASVFELRSKGSRMNGEPTSVAVEEVGTKAPELERTIDNQWRERAAKVLPRGAYGHVRPEYYPANFPQFYGRAKGARIWDVDGNCYLDLMCSWGPMIVGYNNPLVEAAFREEYADRDIAFGHSPRSVELAERLTGLIDSADWAMFQKNGGDATTVAVMIARHATGKRKLLKAGPSYHGATPAFTPWLRGVTPEERANIITFVYNDTASVEAAIDEAGDDFAALIILPYRHDNSSDSEPVDPVFARRVRELCDQHGAVLILDDVRAGFRTTLAGSWAPLGIRPDLSAFSKCIANGHPLAAVTGTEALAKPASEIYSTGSFWYGSAAQAAGLACLDILERDDGPAIMAARGIQLMEGLREQALAHGVNAVVSGPPALPMLQFHDAEPNEYAFIWAEEILRRGVLVHPNHNWFLSTAHTETDIAQILEASDGAFAYLAAQTR